MAGHLLIKGRQLGAGGGRAVRCSGDLAVGAVAALLEVRWGVREGLPPRGSLPRQDPGWGEGEGAHEGWCGHTCPAVSPQAHRCSLSGLT